MMGRFSDWLLSRQPMTGRQVKENGDPVNVADICYAGGELGSPVFQAVYNGGVEFGKRVSVASANSEDPLYFYLDIPAGRRFYLWSRILELTEGRYEVDLVSADSASGGTPAYKTRLYQGGADTVQTQVLTDVSVTGTPQVVLELPLVETGTALGGSRAGGAANVSGVLKSFTADDPPVLIRVLKVDGAADFTASLAIIAWEEEA